MPRIKSDKVTIFAAVSPENRIVISSVSAYYSVAHRWSLKYRNHKVVEIAHVDRDFQSSAPISVAKSEEKAPEESSEPKQAIQMPRSNGHSVRVPPRKRVVGMRKRA